MERLTQLAKEYGVRHITVSRILLHRELKDPRPPARSVTPDKGTVSPGETRENCRRMVCERAPVLGASRNGCRYQWPSFGGMCAEAMALTIAPTQFSKKTPNGAAVG